MHTVERFSDSLELPDLTGVVVVALEKKANRGEVICHRSLVRHHGIEVSQQLRIHPQAQVNVDRLGNVEHHKVSSAALQPNGRRLLDALSDVSCPIDNPGELPGSFLPAISRKRSHLHAVAAQARRRADQIEEALVLLD